MFKKFITILAVTGAQKVPLNKCAILYDDKEMLIRIFTCFFIISLLIKSVAYDWIRDIRFKNFY